MADGNNLHSVYHSTHQTPSHKIPGFCQDVLRMQAVIGGSYSQTNYLLVQQWVDYLTGLGSGKFFLQFGTSEGAVHVNAALRLLQAARPDLLPRIRVLLLCPAHFILPTDYPEVQVMNFVKREDRVINPWGVNTDQIGRSENIVFIPHELQNVDPHNPYVEDFEKVVRPFVFRFLASGSLF